MWRTTLKNFLPSALVLLMLSAQCAAVLHYPAHMVKNPAQEQQQDGDSDCPLCTVAHTLGFALLVFLALSFGRRLRIFRAVETVPRFFCGPSKSFFATGPPALS